MATLPVWDRSAENGSADRHLSSNWNDQRGDIAWDATSIVSASLVTRGAGQPIEAALAAKSNPRKQITTAIDQPKADEQGSLINVPRLFTAKAIAGRSVNTLQEWEGLVQSIEGESFTARLRDLTAPDRLEEVAEISFDGIDPADHERVKPGAVFHLIVGYTRRNGSQRLETFTYFRRHLPQGREAALEVVELLDLLEGDAD